MATRRPPIPRANRAGQPAGQRGENGAPEDTGPVAKVIPLGAVPRGSRPGGEGSAGGRQPQQHDAGASAGARRTNGAKPAPKSGGNPGGTKAGANTGGGNRGGAKAGAAKAGGAKAGGAKPGVPRAPRTRRPASEQRARERAELSGAIRAPQGAASSSGGPAAGKSGSHTGTKGTQGGRAGGAGGPGGPSAPGGGQPVPARSFSGRLLALAVVLVAITVLLLPSVGTYASQRSEIAELRESIAAKEAEQADLKQQIARWDDPVYIKQQARDRINLVMPGERKYMVIGSVAEDEPVPDNESPGEVRQDLPWVDALWDTTRRAATD